MKRIIQHGYKRYEIECGACQCYFSYELEDINEKNTVTCHECGKSVMHFSHNHDFTSRIGANNENS